MRISSSLSLSLSLPLFHAREFQTLALSKDDDSDTVLENTALLERMLANQGSIIHRVCRTVICLFEVSLEAAVMYQKKSPQIVVPISLINLIRMVNSIAQVLILNSLFLSLFSKKKKRKS